MKLIIYKDGNLIVDATLEDTKENLETLRKIALENLKLKDGEELSK